jgi:hypothetical protein
MIVTLNQINPYLVFLYLAQLKSHINMAWRASSNNNGLDFHRHSVLNFYSSTSPN